MMPGLKIKAEPAGCSLLLTCGLELFIIVILPFLKEPNFAHHKQLATRCPYVVFWWWPTA